MLCIGNLAKVSTTKKHLLIALLTVLAVLAVPAGAQALTVYAAASLRDAFPRIDGSPTYSFLGSNQLQAQIERGAPADVFASAGPDEAGALFRAGLCTRPVTFATNVVVLVTPKGNPSKVRSVYSLRTGSRRLSVGTAGVPIGAYTRQVLTRLRLTSILRTNRVSLDPNVAAITSKVALGSADAGFVYSTDAKAVDDRTETVSLPRWAQPPVRYGICVVRRAGVDTAAANAFIAKVRATNGRRILKSYGFGLPPRG
jgi:molybdate transport system substrate-binding protein